MEKYGRKPTLMWANIFYILGAILAASGYEKALYAGRLLSGFGLGASSVVAPVLLSEIASDSNRGKITTFHPAFITGGIFAAGLVGYGFVTYVNHGWQYVQAFAIIPSLIMIRRCYNCFLFMLYHILVSLLLILVVCIYL
jgi:MFS family permease